IPPLQDDAYSRDIRGLNASNVLEIFGTPPLSRDDLLKRPLHVCGCDRLTVVPLRTLRKVKSINRCVLRGLPLSRQPGDDLPVSIPSQQLIEYALTNFLSMRAKVRKVNIEVVRVACEANDQRASP